jgi:uncharacterized protein YndB with AHSA1/START domain
MNEARTISVSIARSPSEVYEYLADPARFPEWSVFITAMRREADHWRALTQHGEVRMSFTPRNALGVLDHDVLVNPQLTVHVPMRVVKNGEGSEVLFTIFRQPGMSAQDYDADVALVRTDLLSLKRLLEREKSA